MAFVNSKGNRISFECTELINEVKNNMESNGNELVVGCYQNINGVKLYYGFLELEDIVRLKSENEILSSKDLLNKLIEQNSR